MSDELRKKALEYASAQDDLELADLKVSEVKRDAQNARANRDACECALHGFVGRNLPRKLVSISKTKAVLIQMDPTTDAIYVSVEAVI